MAKINKARFAILGMLAMIGPASGYDIKKVMAHSTDHFWKESDGALYPSLKQLSDEGLVTFEIENPKSGKPKKIYTITEDGMAEFLEWMADDVELSPARDEFLLKIFFGSLTDKSVSLKHLKDLRYLVEKKLKGFETIQNQMQNEPSKNVYQYLTLRKGIYLSKALLAWCDEAQTLLEH